MRPPLSLFLTEPGRALLDYGALLATAPAVFAAPRGDGHPVVVIPGLLADDTSTSTMRLYLRGLGYNAHGWGLGRNLGPTPATQSGMRGLLTELHDVGRVKVSLVGWSLGGIFARELARRYPRLVRQVITLGSPFRLADPRDSRANGTYERLNRIHLRPEALPSREDLGRPIPVPSTAIYSKFDGIVPWQACIDAPGPGHENVAVYGSHLGFGHNPAVLWVIADRLAQREGAWRPFRPPAWAGRLFPARVAAAA